jgi:hypothetical protein
MKKCYAVRCTPHYTDYYVVEIEGEDKDEMMERVCRLVQQEMFNSYHTKPRDDDCNVDLNEISEDEVQKIEREFGCERERVYEDEEPLANIDK